MPYVVYSSRDDGAPTPSGAGTIPNILEACLVTGYGSKPAAGWTKPYENTATNVKVFKNGDASFPLFVRVKGTFVYRGYLNMTGPDTGHGPFPTLSQVSGDGISFNLSASSLNFWMVFADEKTFVLYGIDSTIHCLAYFGYTPLFDGSDAAVISATSANGVTGLYYFTSATGSFFDSSSYLLRKDGLSPIRVVSVVPTGISSANMQGVFNPGVNAVVPVQPLTLSEVGASGGFFLYGKYRMLYTYSAPFNSIVNLTRLVGTDSYSGKEFIVLRVRSGQATTAYDSLALVCLTSPD
jgi:hypothetical protein